MKISKSYSTTENYTWGRLITIHNGNRSSYPLHPEHQALIAALDDGAKIKFTDETGRAITAKREDSVVKLKGSFSNETVKFPLDLLN